MRRNIVLIGMPGCGKTTIGRIIAKELGITFVDVDEYIVEKENKTITELFKNGEEYFREIEKLAVAELSLINNIVIATGGGVIKNQINIEYLQKSGLIIFIDRSIKEIALDIEVENRPLLHNKPSNLVELFEERYPLYNNYADYVVLNEGSAYEIAKRIIGLIELES